VLCASAIVSSAIMAASLLSSKSEQQIRAANQTEQRITSSESGCS
jgi:hypothetical protein